ncbi:MAG: anthranilate phosphoribosyltransferase [Chromatiales bacterium]|jgi:anthranilate phosphoribosyltransferase|nr:anthranilate phosphoribosyltransferase [Chromatiales bacterium]
MDMQAAIRAVTEGQSLSADEMRQTMRIIMTGEATQAQIGGFLIGLRMKGETVEEIAAAAAVMRDLASGVSVDGEHVVDIVGTGGDATKTFNISTTAAFIVAAAGGKVAKHGNRSVSSTSGAADLLEAAGVRLDLTPARISQCVDEIGVGFMFAPHHHSAMRHAIGPRREMAVRTVFNLLGPLTNPAGAPNQLLGVFAREWVEPIANVLERLGSNHVLVVHSHDGLDEISIGAPTDVAELQAGKVTTYQLDPERFGISRSPLEAITVNSAAESLAMVNSVLANEPGPPYDIAVLNAGAGIYAANLVPTIEAGIKRAKAVIASGEAATRLGALAKLTQNLAENSV